MFNDIDKSDEPTYFKNNDQVKALLDQHFSNGMMPEPLENFDDFEKDETVSDIAFYGFGQNFLRKTEDNAGNAGAVYEVDTTILSQIETRSGFEMFGANAFFGKDKKLLQIYVSSMGRIIKPGDAEWKHAKWVWRVSLMTLVSVGTHLSQVLKFTDEFLAQGAKALNGSFFLKLVQCEPQLNCEIQPIVVEGVHFNHT